ncbi:LysR family transcriptional regulator [Photobacterium sanctipauli]|uniref:LysR family transcriptional regulator n=1 Tax=Photobacterium sanctipauli TaxID=1342794 RepID=A0A2T3NMY1_9GAMM|nr:LysR family transcriptional regulator [Photobacterium sanctipauli]PSW16876.1 LysR family transcriptional regulator [Photobacterium sanctipauli]
MSITNQLSLFHDVVQQGSFSKAAALHNMDNSSLSKQIKKLEATLGVQLLNRSTRSFSLTSAGEEILEQTQVLLDTVNQIQNIADSYQAEPTGTLRITSPVYFGQEYLQPVISRFMKKYPKVKVTLSLNDRMADIIGDQFDVAFRISKLAESNLIAKRIAKTNFAIIASKEFIERYGNPKTPEELIALPAVIYTNGDFTLDQLRLSTGPNGNELKTYRMQGNYKVTDVRAVVDAVKDGVGYSLFDLFYLKQSADELGLVPLLTDHVLSTMETGIYALYPNRKQTPLMREFIKAVQEDIGDPPIWLNHIPNYQQCYK